MGDVSLAELFTRAPNGLSVPIGCWLVARVAEKIDPARPVTPDDVRVSARGEISIAKPRRPRFAYTAPEVLSGAEPDARAAVFALGALLVEALTGRSPFERGSDLETRVAVREDPVRPLAGRVPDATHGLDALIQRALAKKPEVRFSTAGELALRLDAFLADELFHADAESLGKVVVDAMGPALEATSPAPIRAEPVSGVRAKAPVLPSYADATLELTPVKRVVSPVVPPAALDRAITRDDREPAQPAPSPRAADRLDIDETVLQKERARPKAIEIEEPVERGPSWMLRIAAFLIALLALALAYQFVVRPLLK